MFTLREATPKGMRLRTVDDETYEDPLQRSLWFRMRICIDNIS